MGGGNEQRVAIKFCFKAGLSATETLVLVQKAYGNEALNQLNLFRWYSQFWNGRDLVEGDERGGHPKSNRTDINNAAVADLVKNDSWIASGMISEFLNIPKTVKVDLGKKKLCARFIPHSLAPEQREDRVKSCQDIIMKADADKNFCNKFITGDETWWFAYEPETKRQSSERVGETSPQLKKLKFQRFHIKHILIIFFNSQGIVHKEFVPERWAVRRGITLPRGYFYLFPSLFHYRLGIGSRGFWWRGCGEFTEFSFLCKLLDLVTLLSTLVALRSRVRLRPGHRAPHFSLRCFQRGVVRRLGDLVQVDVGIYFGFVALLEIGDLWVGVRPASA